MKFNYSAPQINAGRRDTSLSSSHPMTSLPVIAKYYGQFERNIDQRNYSRELTIANKMLAFQNKEKENRAAELLIANKELAFQNKEKENRAAELNSAYKELEKADEDLRGYIQGLEKMMFITSHKVRQPVCSILGIVSVIDQCMNSPAELKKMVKYLKISALSLDSFTKELTKFIFDLEQKGKR